MSKEKRCIVINTDVRGSEVRAYQESDYGHVYSVVDETDNLLQMISFQKGAFVENDVNGITSEQLIEILIHRTQVLNSEFPSPENDVVIGNLLSAKGMLELRRHLRTTRGVNDKEKL